MKKIAVGGVAVLGVLAVLMYTVWPLVSSAFQNAGDDAPIRVRGGSVIIDSSYEDVHQPGNHKKWKWVGKGNCKYKDGSQAPCISHEPVGVGDPDRDRARDVDHDRTLYVKVDPGEFGTCNKKKEVIKEKEVITGSGELVEVWVDDAKPLYFTFRRNTSGFTHYRVQLSPRNPFNIMDDGATAKFETSKDGYIEDVRVGDLTCHWRNYDKTMEIKVCAPWQKIDCGFKEK
jgi:hypothetical protein